MYRHHCPPADQLQMSWQIRRNQICSLWLYAKYNLFYLHKQINLGTEIIKQHASNSLVRESQLITNTRITRNNST